MTDIAQSQPSRGSYQPDHIDFWRRFRWFTPLLITFAVTIGAIVRYWPVLNSDGATFLPIGLGIMLSIFLSALPASICFVQNVSRRRQISKLKDLESTPLAKTTLYETAIRAIDSVRLVVDADYGLPMFLFFLIIFIGFTVILTAFSHAAWFGTASVLLGGLEDRTDPQFAAYQLQTFAVMAMAFIGAYIYAIGRILDRINNNDLYPVSLYYYTARVIIACAAAAVLRHTIRVLGEATGAVISNGFSGGASPLLLLLGFAIGFAPDLFIVAITRKAFQTLKIWGSRDDPDAASRPTSLPLLMIDDLTREKIDRLNELEIDSAQVLAQQNPFRLLPRVPFDLSLLIDWIAQAQLYVIVGTDDLAKLRRIYIHNIFELEIRLKNDEARAEICTALDFPTAGAAALLKQIEDDPSFLRLREVKDAMKPQSQPIAPGGL
jgi:hypothetical protein